MTSNSLVLRDILLSLAHVLRFIILTSKTNWPGRFDNEYGPTSISRYLWVTSVPEHWYLVDRLSLNDSHREGVMDIAVTRRLTVSTSYGVPPELRAFYTMITKHLPRQRRSLEIDRLKLVHICNLQRDTRGCNVTNIVANAKCARAGYADFYTS